MMTTDEVAAIAGMVVFCGGVFLFFFWVIVSVRAENAERLRCEQEAIANGHATYGQDADGDIEFKWLPNPATQPKD